MSPRTAEDDARTVDGPDRRNIGTSIGEARSRPANQIDDPDIRPIGLRIGTGDRHAPAVAGQIEAEEIAWLPERSGFRAASREPGELSDSRLGRSVDQQTARGCRERLLAVVVAVHSRDDGRRFADEARAI